MAKPYYCKEAQAAPLHERGHAAMSNKNSVIRHLEKNVLLPEIALHAYSLLLQTLQSSFSNNFKNCKAYSVINPITVKFSQDKT